MNVFVNIIAILFISLLAFQADSKSNNSVTIVVEGAKSNDGYMFIALYNSESDFLKSAYKRAKIKIENKMCTTVFEDLPEGIYAVSIFHDENDNGKMDTNFFGIPTEDYGCSNNARGVMGPPKWQDAKFELKESQTIKITL